MALSQTNSALVIIIFHWVISHWVTFLFIAGDMTYILGNMTQVTGYMTLGEMTFRQLDWLPLPLVSRTDFSFQ